jgi:hypothetical protein
MQAETTSSRPPIGYISTHRGRVHRKRITGYPRRFRMQLHLSATQYLALQRAVRSEFSYATTQGIGETVIEQFPWPCFEIAATKIAFGEISALLVTLGASLTMKLVCSETRSRFPKGFIAFSLSNGCAKTARDSHFRGIPMFALKNGITGLLPFTNLTTLEQMLKCAHNSTINPC